MTNAKHIELVEQAKVHFAADMLIKGTYGEEDQGEFKGCSVGCHLYHIHPDMNADEISDISEKHLKVAEYYEYPEWLAHLQDQIFEGLPNGESAKWHVQMAEAIASRNGVIDWQQTLHLTHIAILRISYRNAGTAQDVVKTVLDLHERAARGEAIEQAEWSAARSAAAGAAWSAAAGAARSAAWSAAAGAARSAAWSAAYEEIRGAVLDVLCGKTTA